MRIRNKRALAAAVAAAVLMGIAGEAKPKAESKKQNEKNYPAVLWRDPGDVSSKDLFYGPGGKEHVPRGPFKFEREDMQGTNPKFDVTDGNGVRWRVKMGVEARPETAASRFAWATGYFADEEYFVTELQVQNLPRLRRGRQLVSEGNIVRDVRLKRHLPDEKKVGTWSWDKDPFTGTKEWYGLRALMAVLNNWDLKDTNNSVYLTRGGSPEEHYLVSDLGASFGPTGLDWMLKGRPNEYCKSKFIKTASGGYVDFAAPSGPALNYCIDFPELGRRLSLQWLGRHIPREDARWIGDLLARLSAAQIRAAFRSAGYSIDEVERLSQTLEKRIAELEKL